MSRPTPVPPPRLAESVAGAKLPPLRPAQRACYDALGLALKEGHVFAALTGPAGSGKTTVLEAVIADLRDRSLRCIRIGDPDKVPAKLAAQIEQVAYAEAAKSENLERHVVLAVDDAHAGSEELMGCLARLAAIREPGRRVPQVLLVGAPELWNRLAAEEYEPLERRLAIRAVLPQAVADDDPWASFPDPPPRAAEPPSEESRRRVLLPLGILFVSIAACALVLSFYDWPDLLEGLPWADQKAAAPFVIPSSPRAQSTGLPQPPAWTQNGQHVPPAAAPATQPPASQPIVATPPYETPAPQPPAATASAPPRGEPPAHQAAAPAPPKAAPQPAPTEASGPAARPPSTVSAPPAEAELTQPPGQQASARPPAPSAAPARAHDVRPTATAPATPVTQVARVAPEIITLLLRRGDEQFTIGDVSAARLLYQRAAEAGSAAGARLEARTYDAAFLPPSGATTLADRDAARLWYSRAAALGDVEAATRLKTLNGGR